MAELMKHITDESTGLTYTLNGDYYFPDMGLTEEEQKPVGKYGAMRKAYLEEHHPGLYTRLLLSGKLMEHLREVDTAARVRLERIIECMAKAEGVNEKLKARDPLAWVGLMNNIKARAEESIMAELIYE